MKKSGKRPEDMKVKAKEFENGKDIQKVWRQKWKKIGKPKAYPTEKQKKSWEQPTFRNWDSEMEN